MRVALLFLTLAVLSLPSIATAPAPDAQPVVAATASLSRHLVVGAGAGALTGAAFALAVVSLADCAGSKCTGERVAGVVGHAVVGAAVGALVGAVVHRIRR